MTSLAPRYQIFTLDLGASVAAVRQVDIEAEGNIVQLIGISDASGNAQPSGFVNIQIGTLTFLGDLLPFHIDSRLRVDSGFNRVRLTWPQQTSGWTAYVMVSDDRQGAGVDARFPSSASVLGGSITTAEGSVMQERNPEGGSLYAASLGTVAVETIVAPGTNVNGLVIRTAFMLPATSSGELYGETSAPAGVNDRTKRCLLSAQNATAFAGPTILPYPTRLAAGVGLYFAHGNASPDVRLTYDLL